jgi:MFS family permease
MSPAESTAWISAAAFFCCVCMAVPIMHLPPLAVECGLPDSVGARALMIVMAAGTVGRVVFGALADRVGALATYALASLIQTATAFWFTQASSVAFLFAVAAIFGFGFAGNMTSIILAVREAVPVRMVGLSTAITTLMAWVGMGVGGLLGGYLFDLTGVRLGGGRRCRQPPGPVDHRPAAAREADPGGLRLMDGRPGRQDLVRAAGVEPTRPLRDYGF